MSQANTALLAELDLPKPESVTVKGAGGTPMQMWILKPPGFDADEEMAAGLSGPRRPARRVGRRLELSLEPRAVGGAGLRRRPAESARQHRLRPEVRRRNQRRLGRQVLRRPDGRPGLSGEAALHRHRAHGRRRRLVRRLHDELVRRAHRHVQDADHALRRLQLRQHVRHDRRTVVRRMGARRPARGASASRTKSTRRTASPRTSRRRC